MYMFTFRQGRWPNSSHVHVQAWVEPSFDTIWRKTVTYKSLLYNGLAEWSLFLDSSTKSYYVSPSLVIFISSLYRNRLLVAQLSSSSAFAHTYISCRYTFSLQGSQQDVPSIIPPIRTSRNTTFVQTLNEHRKWKSTIRWESY